MNYIVIDLEFTVMRQKKHLSDIIEIGSVKLTVDEGEIAMTDLFHSYVRPSTSPVITPLTTAFTGITQRQVDSAPPFPEAIQNFANWLGEEPYYLLAWGPDDKLMLVKQCEQHGLGLGWIRNYNDIQLQFTYQQGGNKGGRWGLTKALAALNIPFFGTQHRALDDAFNTAKLFKEIFPLLKLQENNAAEERMQERAIVYSTGREAHRPFSQLAKLLETAI